MGIEIFRSRTDCYNCPVCSNNHCDGCSHYKCVECMNNHRYLRNLEDDFKYKIYDSKSFIKNKCVEEINFLNNCYHTNICYEDNGDELKISRDILDRMKDKIREIQNEIQNIINSLNQKLYENEEFKELLEKQKEEMENIKRDFEKKYKEIQEKFYEDINEKIEKKNQLLKEKKKLNEENDCIAKKIEEEKNKMEKYKFEEENKFENEFIKKKEEINLKYSDSQTDIILTKEYNEMEKKEKNDLENIIRQIKNYSKFIPNFENFMDFNGITNYL